MICLYQAEWAVAKFLPPIRREKNVLVFRILFLKIRNDIFEAGFLVRELAQKREFHCAARTNKLLVFNRIHILFGHLNVLKMFKSENATKKNAPKRKN